MQFIILNPPSCKSLPILIYPALLCADTSTIMTITDLPFDIQIMIMTTLGDLRSLRSLVIAVPCMQTILSTSFCTITTSALPVSFRQRDILAPLYACMAAHRRSAMQNNDLKAFLIAFFGDVSRPITLPPGIPGDIPSINYIISLHQTIEDLLPFTWPEVLGIPTPWTLTSEPIYFGARRALLRIQLYTELFHKRLNDIKRWRPRQPDVQFFWGRFSAYDNHRCHFLHAKLIQRAKCEMDRGLTVVEGPENARLRGLPVIQWVTAGNPITSSGKEYIKLLLKQDVRAFNMSSGYGRK